MSTANAVSGVNRDVLELWRQQFAGKESVTRCPLLYPELNAHGLVVVGCNPSLPKRNHYDPPMLHKVIANPASLSSLTDLEARVRRDYPYFQPAARIAQALGPLPWAHVDLFFERGTSQKVLEAEFCDSVLLWDAPVNLPEFAEKQVALALRLVEACRPQILLVANAFASKIIRSRLRLGKLDEKGLLWASIADRLIPVFLSGMLSGQRALDRGSLERLVWHMQKALGMTLTKFNKN